MRWVEKGSDDNVLEFVCSSSAIVILAGRLRDSVLYTFFDKIPDKRGLNDIYIRPNWYYLCCVAVEAYLFWSLTSVGCTITVIIYCHCHVNILTLLHLLKIETQQKIVISRNDIFHFFVSLDYNAKLYQFWRFSWCQMEAKAHHNSLFCLSVWLPVCVWMCARCKYSDLQSSKLQKTLEL